VEDNSKIGIIVVSAADELGLLRARKLGADETLEKPFTRKKLIKAVEDLLCKAHISSVQCSPSPDKLNLTETGTGGGDRFRLAITEIRGAQNE